ncbi:hypothetical protein APUTEX25_003051, partial [Auxenochlorella protothecoides]
MEDMQTDMERIQQAYMEQATRNEKLATALRSDRRCLAELVETIRMSKDDHEAMVTRHYGLEIALREVEKKREDLHNCMKKEFEQNQALLNDNKEYISLLEETNKKLKSERARGERLSAQLVSRSKESAEHESRLHSMAKAHEDMCAQRQQLEADAQVLRASIRSIEDSLSRAVESSAKDREVQCAEIARLSVEAENLSAKLLESDLKLEAAATSLESMRTEKASLAVTQVWMEAFFNALHHVCVCRDFCRPCSSNHCLQAQLQEEVCEAMAKICVLNRQLDAAEAENAAMLAVLEGERLLNQDAVNQAQAELKAGAIRQQELEGCLVQMQEQVAGATERVRCLQAHETRVGVALDNAQLDVLDLHQRLTLEHAKSEAKEEVWALEVNALEGKLTESRKLLHIASDEMHTRLRAAMLSFQSKEDTLIHRTAKNLDELHRAHRAELAQVAAQHKQELETLQANIDVSVQELAMAQQELHQMRGSQTKMSKSMDAMEAKVRTEVLEKLNLQTQLSKAERLAEDKESQLKVQCGETEAARAVAARLQARIDGMQVMLSQHKQLLAGIGLAAAEAGRHNPAAPAQEPAEPACKSPGASAASTVLLGKKYVDLGGGDGTESGESEEEHGPDSFLVAVNPHTLDDPGRDAGAGDRQGHPAAPEVVRTQAGPRGQKRSAADPARRAASKDQRMRKESQAPVATRPSSSLLRCMHGPTARPTPSQTSKPRGGGRVAGGRADMLHPKHLSASVLQLYVTIVAYSGHAVTEGDRISIAEQLKEFQHSEETEYKFPPGLSNHDRAVVHAECKKYGFTSKSYGKGDNRAVTLLAAVAAHRVVLVSGETGCGKTTQVPQYLLEDAWAAGRGCHVLCTQPRRISAVSCAERIAAERGEAPGVNVGYNIRLESCGGRDASLLFATNGVLLRMLSSGADALAHVTHLVMDEIHERDRFADFALILVRDVLPANPNLRVVLMSATLHADLFSGVCHYFGGCPMVRVPGFTHPVEDFYLEEVLRLVQYQVPREAQGQRGGQQHTWHKARPGRGLGLGTVPRAQRAAVQAAVEAAFKDDSDAAFEHLLSTLGLGMDGDGAVSAHVLDVQHEATGATALMAAAGRGRLETLRLLLAHGADVTARSQDGSSAAGWARMFGHADVAAELEQHEQQAAAAAAISQTALAVAQYQSETDIDEVDLDLILRLLQYICGEGPFSNPQAQKDAQPGAVLIFLPGWDEISRLKELLERDQAFRRTHSGSLILPLHSMVAPAEQRRVFQRPPRGVRKLVLATNIAETAITIDDVVVVINAGRLREKGYDPFTGSAWISRASERQRRGRAGRCQPGTAFHLYTRTRSEALAEFQVPELRRSPLEELALQIKLLEVEGQSLPIAEFLAKAIDPPVPQAIKAARQLLEDIGALDEAEHLTPLGRHLANIPLPPALGKLLLYGAMFKCLDPILTLACFKAYREPWVLPTAFDARAAAWNLRCQMAEAIGGASDHMACLHAFQCYKDARRNGRERGFCAQNFISPSTMAMVDGMRGQLASELQRLGFIRDVGEASSSAADLGLVRAVLAAGLYPMVGRLLPPTSGRAMVMTRRGEKVRIHPSSVNAKMGLKDREADSRGTDVQENRLLVIDDLTRGDASLYVKACSEVPALALLLVAASVQLTKQEESEDEDSEGEPDDGVGRRATRPAAACLVMDEWLRFRVDPGLVAPLARLRARLAGAFQCTVQDARGSLSPEHTDAVRTVAGMLAGARSAHAGHCGGGAGRPQGPTAPYAPTPPRNY